MTAAARRRGGIAVLAVAVWSLAACARLGLPSPIGAAEPAPTPRPAAQPAPPPSDPLLYFVTRAAPGQATFLDDPLRGRIEIRLEREYYSADAVVCRRFTVTVRQDIQTRVACRQPDGWQLDAILDRGLAR